MRTVTQAQALKALATLTRFGAQAYNEGSAPGMSKCVGMALARLDLRPRDILNLASEAMEEHNAHTFSGLMNSLHDGVPVVKGTYQGSKGGLAEVSVVMPEEWAERGVLVDLRNGR